MVASYQKRGNKECDCGGSDKVCEECGKCGECGGGKYNLQGETR